jgi:spermidine/putrescine transport system ATP-binding protein
MSESYVVELVDVSKVFGDFVALDGVNLRIRDGEFFSLLGPSGCGKTTSLRLIAGFEVPTAGEVRIGGKRMDLTPPHKRPVNTVFQSYALFPHMTVSENVSFGLEMQKVPRPEIRQRVEAALDMVQLPSLGNRKPKQLSGGQQQRVALARALVNRPRVLLLDEPLGALDLKLRKAMQLELKALQNKVGITFIYVTHDQEEALTMSNRIAVMNRGEVLQVGTPSEIYETPANNFVADFIGETNLLKAEVTRSVGDRLELTLAGGERVVAIGPPQAAPGRMATLAVRPERIQISLQSEPDLANQFAAEVVEIVYTGATTGYLLRLGPAVTLTVRRPNTERGAGKFARGIPVMVSWPLEAASVFLDEEPKANRP